MGTAEMMAKETTLRDKILEKCETDIERTALTDLLDACDECGVRYEICKQVDIEAEYKDFVKNNPTLFEDCHCEDTKLDLHSFNSIRDNLEYEEEMSFQISPALDVFFPENRIFLNIGKSFESILSKTEGEVFNLAHVKLYIFLDKFIEELNEKYQLPHKTIDNKKVMITWCHNEPGDDNHIIGLDNALISQLIAYSGKKLIENRRKERFLSAHPDIKEKREQMLHSLVIEMQQNLGLDRSLDIGEIEILLETVDKELYILYPDYSKIHII